MADRSRECCGRAGLGQHPCPHGSALAQQACSALSAPWWERANGWRGSVLSQSSAQGEKGPSCTGELGCGSPSCWDTVPSRSCIVTELTRGCREKAALPTVELPAKMQTCRTSPWLSAKSSQSLAGRREISPDLALLRGEWQVFCGVELVKEFLVVLGLQSQNVLKLMQVTVGVKGRKLGWVPRTVGGWLCPQASQVLPIPAVRAQLDLPLAPSSACWGGSTPQGASVPFVGCHHLCSSPARFPSFQLPTGVTKLITFK